jgi:transposase
MSKPHRRNFTPEFKLEAVKLVLDQGLTIAQVSRELAINESVIGRWVHQARIDRGEGPTGALTSAERSELSALRKEVQRLRSEHSILKKAAAFFAKESL